MGKVSLTADLWSDSVLKAYMAITAHYLLEDNGKLLLRSGLIAFHHIPGKHDAKTLAQHFVALTDRAGITTNVCTQQLCCVRFLTLVL